MKPNIIFDFAHDEPQSVEDVLRHVGNLQANYPQGCTIEVMAYGPGLTMLLQTSPARPQVSDLLASGITFLACQNTMRRLSISDDDLLLGITQASSGLGHIVDRQLEGWAYLKS